MSKRTNGLPQLKAKKLAFKAKRALRNKNPKNVVPIVGHDPFAANQLADKVAYDLKVAKRRTKETLQLKGAA